MQPSSGDYTRMISDMQAGTHTLPLAGTPVDKATWKAVTYPWSTTLVVCWNDVPKYAGIVLTRTHERPTNSLTITHQDLRLILSRRFSYNINDYEPTNVLSFAGQSLRGLAASVVRRPLRDAGGEQWTLPVVIPAAEAGAEKRDYYAYDFTTAESMLDEIESADGGPDVDFEPRWSPTTGRLEWVMRIGTPRLSGGLFDFHVNVEEPRVFDLKATEDGSAMLTGLIAIGKGSERDMKLGKGLSLDGPVIPFLDSSQPFKEIDEVDQLNSHAVAEVKARRSATKQWELKVRTDSIDLGALRLGSTVRLHFSGDVWEDDGVIDQYVIGIRGSTGSTLTLDVQDLGRL